MKHKILEEAKKENKKQREKKESETKAEIRRMDLQYLESMVKIRKEIYERIKRLHDKDLALLKEAELKLAIYLGEE